MGKTAHTGTYLGLRRVFKTLSNIYDEAFWVLQLFSQPKYDPKMVLFKNIFLSRYYHKIAIQWFYATDVSFSTASKLRINELKTSQFKLTHTIFIAIIRHGGEDYNLSYRIINVN